MGLTVMGCCFKSFSMLHGDAKDKHPSEKILKKRRRLVGVGNFMINSVDCCPLPFPNYPDDVDDGVVQPCTEVVYRA